MKHDLSLTYWPTKVLVEKAELVKTFDSELSDLADAMCSFMLAAEGWGLAAPQIGKGIQLCVVSAAQEVGLASTPLVLVNPVIIEKSGGIQTGGEGCLSLSDIVIKVQRAMTVKVAAFDVHGEPMKIEASGVGAVVLQHEIDHLAGKMITDYLPFGKQKMARDIMKKFKKGRAA